ncbi:MAG TPA: hypothetical protein VEN78_14590 [Bradyrhizobium sp.]|nr:hypothetical protein [Bradyrhizobium sp.]
MNEEAKLREAAYFLERMRAELSEPEHFKFNLSACLSAGRSVAQYALNEASGRRRGRLWYDAFLKAHPVVKFLATERDTNIHHRPIEPSGHVDVYVTDIGRFNERVAVEKFDASGNLVEVTSSPEPSIEQLDDLLPDAQLAFTYQFDKWAGEEDVPTLCASYLDALGTLVRSGQDSGFLTR